MNISNLQGCGVTSSTTSSTTTTTTSSGCARPEWQADNYCDDINNNAECNYDGGDCCGPNVDTTYCHECQCLDPNFSTTTAPTTTINPVCEDDPAWSSNCAYWVSVGYCTHQDFEPFMKSFCKESCGLCPTTTAPTTTINPTCEDDPTWSSNCAYWVSVGYCTHLEFEPFMKSFCKKSCGLCQSLIMH